MFEIRERVDGAISASTPEGALGQVADLTLTLPFDERQRSRLRVTLSSGEQALLGLARGSVLRGGDLLRLSDGRVVAVVAAEESVSTARSDLPRALLRAAYHLGNRHVPLEIGEGYVRYLHDHVLDGMVRELGLSVSADRAPFEPEGGAYASGRGGHHHHAHDHHHQHGAGDE
jgi:urease accessory protein